MPGFTGTLDLYVDDECVGGGEIVTQPGAVVDVSGKRYVDHEAEVRGWFMLD